MILDDCKLCLAITDSKTKDFHIENTPLFESEYFIILPGIGPLTNGHVLIVSKNHYLSLASMPVAAITECSLIIKDMIEKFGGNCLFTEHGTFNGHKGGACIEHTHIHIIPAFGDHFSLLDNILPSVPEITRFEELVNIADIETPYILNINSNYEFRLYSAYNVHSQMMRKAICSKLGRIDFDWSKDFKIDVIKDTIIKW